MKINKFCYYVSGVALTLALTACGNDQQASAPAPAPADQVVVETSASPAETPGVLSGKVAETMDASGYTYVRLDDGTENEVWAAIPKTQLEVGEEITLQGGSVMNNFSSKSLDRTFESIIFASGVSRGSGDQVVSSADGSSSFSSAVESAGGDASGGSAGNIVEFTELKIEKAVAANAQAVGDIFGMAAELDTQKATVKGQVVKVSRNIMGKNWLHIQDGTGDPTAKTHDLVVTTMDIAEKGDIVTIEGTVTANKDFGSGYKYDVILEEAVVAGSTSE